MKKAIQHNWFFLILFLVMGILVVKRYSYFQVSIVSSPDSSIIFQASDGYLEQTWQPEIKVIAGVDLPYYAEDDFTCNVLLQVLSDDRTEVLGQAQQKAVFHAGEEGRLEFDLGKIKLTQGERYRIRVSIAESSEGEGRLGIASGSNYGGCSIAGEDTGQAAAFQITAGKFQPLFWLAAVLFPMFGCSLFGMVMTGRKWEETVGLSLLVEGMVLYWFGWFGHLNWGVYAVYILGVMCFLTAVWIYNKKGMELRQLFSPGLWVFAVMFVLILLCSYGDWLGMRDDMRHWGIAARDMFYFDSFARHADSTVILSWYFPFAALIEYLFEYMNGMFSEDILLIAYQVMVLSMMLVICRCLQRKEGKRLLLPVMVAMICIPVMFFNYISSSIMVDPLMMAIITYVMVCYYSEEMTKFNFTRITLALACLTLVKDIGMVFAGMLAMIMFIDIIVKQVKEKKPDVKRLLYPVMCVVMVLFLFFSWQSYQSRPVSKQTTEDIKKIDEDGAADVRDTADTKEDAVVSENAAVAQSDSAPQSTSAEGTTISASGITLAGLKKVLAGEGEPYQNKVTEKFLIELFQGETYSLGFFSTSYIGLLALVTFLVLSLGYFGFWQTDKLKMYTFVGALWLASVVLCIFMLVIYWFAFPMYEAMELTSFGRYFAPYLCGAIVTVFYLICARSQYGAWTSIKRRYLVYVLAFFFAVSMPIEGIVVEAKDIEGNTTEEITYGYEQITEILRSVAGKGERAYFICSGSDGYSEYVFRNAICPIISIHWGWDIVASEEILAKGQAIYGERNNATVFEIEEWKKMLAECQYVVVFHADEMFVESYAELFEKPDQISDGSIYQVVHGSEGISLRLIGSTGIKEWH